MSINEAIIIYICFRSLFSGLFNRPIYVEGKDEWEEKMDKFDEQWNTCMYLLRTMERDDISNIVWLQETSDDKR